MIRPQGPRDLKRLLTNSPVRAMTPKYRPTRAAVARVYVTPRLKIRYASDRPEGTLIEIDRTYVRDKVGALAQNADLSRFIL